MAEEKTAAPGFRDYFWAAFSFELALRGLHPDMDRRARELVALRYGKRSLLWLPFDVGLRMAALKASRYMGDLDILSEIDIEEGPEDDAG